MKSVSQFDLSPAPYRLFYLLIGTVIGRRRTSDRMHPRDAGDAPAQSVSHIVRLTNRYCSGEYNYVTNVQIFSKSPDTPNILLTLAIP